MAFSVTQAVNAGVNPGTTVTTAGITTQASGSVFLVFTTCREQDGTVSVTDNKGNTYTRLGEWNNGTAVAASSLQMTGIFISSNTNPVGGSGHTFTYTTGQSYAPSIVAWEVPLSALTQTLDVGGSSHFATGTGSAGSDTPTAIVTSNTNDVLLCVGACAGDQTAAQSFTAAAGGGTYTTPSGGKNDVVVGMPIDTAYQAVSSTGTYQHTFSAGVVMSDVGSGMVAVQQPLPPVPIGQRVGGIRYG